MSIKLKTAAPKAHHAPASTASTKASTAKKTKATGAKDGPAAPKPSTKALHGPVAVPEGPALATIPEAFPIDALSAIQGKGMSGDTFLLDGGSLRGLKLQIRRIKDGDQPGLELAFQVTPGKLEGLLERMKTKHAEAGSITFRGVELQPDGISKYTDQLATITTSSTHAPPDLDDNAAAWALKLKDAKGAVVTVVHDKAALALRGMVRIELSGDDKKCTEQLQGVVNTLGLQYVFAPPTAKSKQLNLLMRALWQADNAAATKLSKGDLDKLKVEDLYASLKHAGFSEERIAGLRYQEVFPGHFTVVDPAQAQAMVDAGARYLYSTVTTPEHVHSILEHGQKSSMQRYKDGVIIDGMSTAADFVTGGGQGVFTRLVTQNAIYNQETWTGRTYKLLQNAAQLGRTDWYGWDGDYFGRRWDLKTNTNFGTALVKKIDADGTYQSTNELIFTAGNRPQNIDRVIATSAEDRVELLKYLQEKNYQPHNGLSREEFVVLSPNFFIFGPSPYAGTKDLEAFAAEALAAVKAGHPAKLQWLLYEAEKGPARIEIEKKLLLGGTAPARDVLFKALHHTGKFAMSASDLDAVIKSLQDGGAKHKEVLGRLTSEAAEALFRSGSAGAYGLLKAAKPDSSEYEPFGINNDGYLRIFEDLASQQVPGAPRSKALELALDLRVSALLEEGNAGFKAFLQKYPLVTPEDPAAWLKTHLASAKKNGSGKTELAIYLSQLSDPAVLGPIQLQLITANAEATLELLKGTMALHQGLHVPGPQLAKAMEALPAKSETRKHLLDSCAAALLKTAEPSLLAMLVAKYKGPYEAQMGIYGGEEWWSILEAQLKLTQGVVNEVVKKTLEIGANQMTGEGKFNTYLSTAKGLYQVDDPAAFAKTAVSQLDAPKAGAAKLTWMLIGPEASKLRMPALLALLKKEDYQAEQVISGAQEPGGKFPATPEQLRALVAQLEDGALTKLLSLAGKDVLLAADQPTLDKLAKHFKDQDQVFSAMGLYGANITALFTALEAQGAAGKKGLEFLLKAGTGAQLKSNDTELLGYLSGHALHYPELGQDAAWAAGVVKGSCDSESYYWTSEYYKAKPEYQTLPKGALYVLKDAAGEYDLAVLGQIQKQLKGWGWEKPVFTAFMARLKDLPDDWKKKLQAAYGAKS
ncbi:MAG: hypothetical protein U1E65_20795 [Myxococcota bacterium]